MINEKGLCAAMKGAWRVGGYEVVGYGEEPMLFINGYGWFAAAPVRQMPRKVLALPGGDVIELSLRELLEQT